jgi:PST family polysaccharide transporter
MAAEIMAKLIGPISFVILTRVLSPTDFGIVAVATTILSFLHVVTDLGISKVLIQESGGEEKIAELSNAGFFFNLFVGLFLFLLMFLGARNLAIFMNAEESYRVIEVLSVQIIFFSLSSVQTALRRKKLQFKFLFYVRLITTLTPTMIAIIFALNGFGYWSIVYGQIAGSLFSTIFLWFSSSWKPSFSFNKNSLIYILSKSVFSSLEQLVMLIPVLLDTYLISNYLNPKMLGMYSTSRSLFTSAITVSLSAILPVIYAYLSKIKNNENAFTKELITFQKVVFSLSLSMGLFVFIFSREIEKIIFTSEWIGISVYFGPMFLIMSCEYFGSTLTEALRAKGFFKILAINTIIATIITIPILFISIKFGLLCYIIARCCSLFIYYPILFRTSERINKVGFKLCFKNVASILVFSFGLILVHYYLKRIDYLFYSIIQVLLYVCFLIFICYENRNVKQLFKERNIITKKEYS